MKNTSKIWIAALTVAAFGAGAGAQRGADYYHAKHPNLVFAQRDVEQANNHIRQAQINNEFDFGGHAQAARDHLAEANKQLGLAEQFIRQHPEKEKK